LTHLEALLKRIDKTPKYSDLPPKPSRDLDALLGRVENRRWKEAMIQETLERLERLQDELEILEHVKGCKDCQVEATLDVERYLGGHSGLWYIELTNGDFLPELYKDCPAVENYKIGSYWSGSSEDTVRFILDRIAWAEPKIKTEIETVVDFFVALEDWDLKSQLPEDTSDENLFSA
jgi:hypothetical protein